MTMHDPSRMVLGIATGTLTIEELANFLAEFRITGKRDYRKIIDLSAAEADFDADGLAPFLQRHQAAMPDGPRGPLALVIGEHQKELARFFATTTIGDRPAEVFRTIHAARDWIARHSATEKAPSRR